METLVDASFIDERLQRITSRQNAKVKQLRQMFHLATPNGEGEVAIEGMYLVEEAICSGLRPGTVLFSESVQVRAHMLPQLPSKTETLLLPDDVFASAVPTETPQGVAALVTTAMPALSDSTRDDCGIAMISSAWDKTPLGALWRICVGRWRCWSEMKGRGASIILYEAARQRNYSPDRHRSAEE